MAAVILYRDISINTTMCKIVEGKTTVILLDFDLALTLDESGNFSGETSRFRTGTLMFMAMDLLDGARGPHLYRYELESFLYVMIWRSCSCVNEEDEIETELHGWLSGSAKQLSLLKSSFYLKQEVSTLPFLPGFSPILSWLRPLAVMFSKAYARAYMERLSESESTIAIDQEDSANETLYGMIIYEKLLEIINIDLEYAIRG